MGRRHNGTEIGTEMMEYFVRRISPLSGGYPPRYMNHDNTDREIKFRFNVRDRISRSDSYHEVDDPPNPKFATGVVF